jgi:ATP-binding cassette subfamily F protein 3
VISAHVDSPFSFDFFKPEKTPAQLLTMDDCDIGYDNIRVLRELTLTISPGDRIGLLGANGAGKSTFIKALANEITAISGTIERANTLKVGYFAQHQIEQLRNDETPLEFLTRLDRSVSERDLRSFLGRFGFSNDYALRAIGPLSGGEKARLVLAAIVRQKPNLLLLDEPTNHLDLQMRHALGVALQGYEGALVVVSHDRYLLESVSDKFKLIANGRIEEFDGNLNDYTKWLAHTRSQNTGLLTKKIVRGESKKERRKREAKSRARKSELINYVSCLEENVNILSKLVSNTNDKLADSNIYLEGRQSELKKLLGEQQIQVDKLRRAEKQWLEATSQLESSQVE